MAMEISNLTKETLARMFKEKKRFDGRKLIEQRDFTVETGISNKAEGSARVILGKTEVLVGVKMDTGTPYPDSLNKGNLMVSGDLLPLASPRFESGPPGFHAIELPRLIDRMLRDSGMINFEKLCIKEGELVWNLIIDIYPINDDGALVDAAGIGAIAALHNAVMPGVDENGKTDYKKRTKDKLPLSDIMPLSFTFYKLGDSIYLDPTREEEESAEAKINWGISKIGKEYRLNSCQKGLEVPFSAQELEEMMKNITGLYDRAIEKLKKQIK